MANKKRFYRTDTDPANFRSIWDRLHDLDDQITAANATIRSQASTITSLSSTLTQADRNARNALIAAGATVTAQSTTTGQPGPSPPPGASPPGSPPGSPGPPAGPGTCSSQPLSASLPAWFSTALVGAGQSTTSNCYSAVFLAAIEATCNANDFTLQRDSGCAVRGRLYHQGNHGMWGTFCGQPDASAVADFSVDVVVTQPDGSVSWGWV